MLVGCVFDVQCTTTVCQSMVVVLLQCVPCAWSYMTIFQLALAWRLYLSDLCEGVAAWHTGRRHCILCRSQHVQYNDEQTDSKSGGPMQISRQLANSLLGDSSSPARCREGLLNVTHSQTCYSGVQSHPVSLQKSRHAHQHPPGA